MLPYSVATLLAIFNISYHIAYNIVYNTAVYSMVGNLTCHTILRTIVILHLSRNSLYTDGRQTPTDDSLIISSIGQADRSFTVPILEGTNRYKGVVHKIHARVPLRSAHEKNNHIVNILLHLLS